jgi:hypothetical protein
MRPFDLSTVKGYLGLAFLTFGVALCVGTVFKWTENLITGKIKKYWNRYFPTQKVAPLS